ncbi:MAG: type II toxin-antitoxin system HipA family toxin [Treponema sp.]|nr:type II toxin-antitoxin system HipA family toxin [Treponema sp.]
MSRLNLKVQIEIDGRFVQAGRITGNSFKDAVFSYDESYVSSPEARAISLSLPLSKKDFDSDATKTFFDGLLPEGFTRQCVAESIHASPDDYISILRELGSECLGAIQIIDEGLASVKNGYLPLTIKEIGELAKEGAGKSAEIVVKSHLSLTGASGKVGLYYEQSAGKWYKPQGFAPSTHIVKQSHVRYKSIVLNEQLCLLTARKLGIEIPESFILRAQKGILNDDNVLFASRRFDRSFDNDSRIIGGLKIPYRLHQEDFAQALGIKSADKYEKNGAGYLKRMFVLLQKHSSNPIDDSLKLWRLAVFNCLIGNTDNHLKNSSLIYSKDLSSIRLAPFYDVICTRIYESCTEEMSVSINGRQNINQITRDDFEKEAKNCGLGSKIAMKIYDELHNGVKNALLDSAEELSRTGFSEAYSMTEKILGKILK